MLDDSVKQGIRDAFRHLSESLPGFRSRGSQRLMVAEIAKVLARGDDEGRRILVVEGPTGTGKTLAYLLATLPVAKHLNKRVVISSATVALQAQLVDRDLPAVAKNSGIEFSYEIAKGRGRYLCTNLLVRETGEDVRQIDAFDAPTGYVAVLHDMRRAFDANKWDGDRDHWRDEIADDIWSKLSTDRHGCMANRCRFYRRCPFFAARASLEGADVVVANHDLVLSDLALGGGVLLSAPEDTIYVFDEAHHLAAKALDHASAWAAVEGTIAWVERCEMLARRVAAMLPEQRNLIAVSEQIDADATAMLGHLRELIQYLQGIPELNASRGSQRGDPVIRYEHGKIPDALRTIGEQLGAGSGALLRSFEKLKEALSRAMDNMLITPSVAETVLPELGITTGRIEGLVKLWTLMLAEDPPDSPPTARWVSRTEFHGRFDFRVEATPISAAGILNYLLWSRCYGAVLTSATLTSLGSFDYFRSRVGLPADPEVSYLRLSSPFDYANAATLWVPWLGCEPSDVQAHTQAITETLPLILAPDCGSLVLFSSRKQMEEVAEGLPIDWRERLLMQGQLQKFALLEEHARRVGAGEGSVIFGLASFAEGVDLPGDLCTHVVIAKLPFGVPVSPIEATEREYIESRGGSHFMQVAVPDACIRLVQAVGRLLRSETDSGTVTLLDRRVVTKRYGKMLLDSLPPFRRLIDDPPK